MGLVKVCSGLIPLYVICSSVVKRIKQNFEQSKLLTNKLAIFFISNTSKIKNISQFSASFSGLFYTAPISVYNNPVKHPSKQNIKQISLIYISQKVTFKIVK